MTGSTLNHPTASNFQTASKRIPACNQSGSNKNEFLKSFENGKLRKNAKKKIQALLDMADTVTLCTQSMGMDDCWNQNEPTALDKSKFWGWYEENYRDLVIYLTVRDGVLTKAMFSDCIYHFSNDVILTFEQEEAQLEKPRFTFVQIVEALKQGYLSPLNHDKKKATPLEPENIRKVVSLGDYQSRVEAKKERLEARAEKAREQSEQFYKASKDRASMIPFGQPILVGHHSEARARRDADRIFNDMGKSVKAQKKADYLESRAESVGSAGIASDDPEAIQKLKSKLDSLVKSQEVMKSINKVVRSSHMSDSDKIEYVRETHQLTQQQAQKLLEPDCMGKVGFAQYALTNNNATIRATKKRIEELERLHNQEPLKNSGCADGTEWELYEEDGRIKFSFDGKPSEQVRTLLKSYGFKWSRYSKAWVRKMTSNAVSSTRYLSEELDKID